MASDIYITQVLGGQSSIFQGKHHDVPHLREALGTGSKKKQLQIWNLHFAFSTMDLVLQR